MAILFMCCRYTDLHMAGTWTVVQTLPELSAVKGQYVAQTSTRDFGSGGVCEDVLLPLFLISNCFQAAVVLTVVTKPRNRCSS